MKRFYNFVFNWVIIALICLSFLSYYALELFADGASSNENITWQKLDVSAASSVSLGSPTTSGELLVLRALMMSVQNACDCYVHYGTSTNVAAAPTTYLITPHFFLDALDTLIIDDAYFKGVADEELFIWFNTDPGVQAIFYKKEQVND